MNSAFKYLGLWIVFVVAMVSLWCFVPRGDRANPDHKEDRLLITKGMQPPEPVSEQPTFPLPQEEPEPEVVQARKPRWAVMKEIEGKTTLEELPDWSLGRYCTEVVPGKKTPIFVYKLMPYEYYFAGVILLSDMDEQFKVGKYDVLAIDRDKGIGIVDLRAFRQSGVEIDKPLAADMLKFCGLTCTPADVFILVQFVWGR